MSEELKPCPFCGSKDLKEDWTSVRTTYDGTKENPTGFHEYQDGWIECKDCEGSIGVDLCLDNIPDSEINGKLVKAWNARHNPIIEELEGLVRELDHTQDTDNFVFRVVNLINKHKEGKG